MRLIEHDEVKAKLDDFIDVMDEVMFEPNCDVEQVTPVVIQRYCALRVALGCAAVRRLRDYLSLHPKLREALTDGT